MAGLDPERFIRANLRVETVEPGIRLYRAHAGSRLGRLSDDADNAVPPYWAYPWGGGAALAFYLKHHPEAVAGRRVADIGTGCGIAAIAAAQAGAAAVEAFDIDPFAIAATRLNAALNGVSVAVRQADVLAMQPPKNAEIVLIGDLFYEADVAARATGFAERCAAEGKCVLIGDPDRVHLPAERLRRIASCRVADVGLARGAQSTPARVFTISASCPFPEAC